MKNVLILSLLSLCMVLSGCSNAQADTTKPAASTPDLGTVESAASSSSPDSSSENKDTATVYPLPDSTMDTLDNGTMAISLAEGDAYLDDTGVMQMKVTIYTYDLFDMVDIAGLKAGDIIVTHAGEVTISSVERNELGTVFINGGLEEDGFDLFSDGGGVYYEIGFNDTKSWHEVGQATLRVSDELEFRDNIDPDKGEQIYYAGSFLVGEVTDYNFTPYNTTIRTENSQVVSMERIYTP